jgi:MinD superfamily P-loop ATPase
MPDKEYRAILTDREIEILQGEADVSEKYYYRVVTRVRSKIQQLDHDLAILDEAHDTLGDEVREIVCDRNEQKEGDE